MEKTAEDFLPQKELRKIRQRIKKFFKSRESTFLNNSISVEDLIQECDITLWQLFKKFPDVPEEERPKLANHTISYRLNELIRNTRAGLELVFGLESSNLSDIYNIYYNKNKKDSKDGRTEGRNNGKDGKDVITDVNNGIPSFTYNGKDGIESPSLREVLSDNGSSTDDDTITQSTKKPNTQSLPASFKMAKKLPKILPLLPDDEREIFLLHAQDGHTFRDIGEMKKCSAMWAQMTYVRAIEKLRTMLTQGE